MSTSRGVVTLYIYAEGVSAAEMNHGPIALIDEGMPGYGGEQHDHTYDTVIAKCRRGKRAKGEHHRICH